MAGVRNRIAHDYRGIDADIVFKIVRNELEIVKKAMLQLLTILDNNQLIKEALKQPYFKHIKYPE